jgi:iron complex outermembrane receptor protein
MGKPGYDNVVWGCFFAVLILLNNAKAQDAFKDRKKNPRPGIITGHPTPAIDTTIAKQPLFSVLKQLNETRGIYFLFSNRAFGELMVTPVNERNRTVEQILDELLQPTHLQFKKINDKTFVIVAREKPAPAADKNGPPANPDKENKNNTALAEKPVQIVKGKVTNPEGKPLPNVSVFIKGANRGTTTNANGDFDIQGNNGDVLELSCVGYEKREITLNHSSPVIYINTQLTLADQMMSEVVVTALGVNKYSRALGYSVSTVSSPELTAAGNTSFASALYGRAPGVLIATAPGGATSAVQVQIRGVNSLNFNAQPIYVLDGVVIRNTNEKGLTGINNGGYWEDARIRGNGILDINPADIENITILKGASATALYGSEAAAGVVVITTKKGTLKKRLGVTLNYTNTIEQAAFLPKYQHEYGPGSDRATNLSEGATEEGWIQVDTDGDGAYDNVRPNFSAYAQFGPKFDGSMVPWWDGEMRPYVAHRNNYRQLYRNGLNSILNAAVSNQTDKFSYRFSFTRNDYKGIQVGGSLQRNTFHLNSNFKVNDALNVDVVSNFTNSTVRNRPFQLNRIIASYSGFISRAEDMDVIFDKYKTSEGFKWVPWNMPQRNPDEALKYNIKSEVLDFLWMQLRNREVEEQNRFLNSFTLNYELNKNWKFRARIGNDFTSMETETKRYSEYPLQIITNTSTGMYGLATGRYSIIYGDGLVTWSKKLTSDLSMSATGGFQTRKEDYNDQSTTTTDGLSKTNWFSLENSFNQPLTIRNNRSAILKYAYRGFFNLAWKNYLFLEGTARQEYSSTLPPGNNSYFYPSINTSFVFSDAFHLPTFISYGKLRASYGIVGNAPPAYTSAVTYSQATLLTVPGPVPSLNAQMNAGNNNIRPENKYETEAGLEAMLFKNKVGVDFTWYNSRTVDQILQLSVPASSGAVSKLVNAGELQTSGVEVSVHAMPLSRKQMKWTTRLNFAFNQARVSKLSSGVSQIVFYEAEQSAIRIVAEEGEAVGNIYIFPRMTDVSGQHVIGANGLYVMDNTRYVKAGNVMPRAIGGWYNSLTWKRFSLDCMIDYRFGGKMVSPPIKYNLGAGMYESTMQYRDEQHGGLPYYIDNVGEKILLPDHGATAPNGSKVYHDGLILPGVTVTGKENTKIVDAAYYYMNTFEWGAEALNESAIHENSYIKMREVILSYNLPVKLTGKLHFNNIRFSLVGRNLFYLWRTLKEQDPETAIGNNWIRQSVDEGSTAANRSFGFSINLDF